MARRRIASRSALPRKATRNSGCDRGGRAGETRQRRAAEATARAGRVRRSRNPRLTARQMADYTSLIRPTGFFMNRMLFVNEATRNFPLDEISKPDEVCAEAPAEISVATKIAAGSTTTCGVVL